MKDDILRAYRELGGVTWLVEVAKAQPENFLRLLARLLPNKVELDSAQKMPVPIRIIFDNGEPLPAVDGLRPAEGETGKDESA